MIKRLEDNQTMLVFSHNARKLAKFYHQKIGLPLTFVGKIATDKEIYFFELYQGGVIYIVDVADKMKNEKTNKNVLNFEVEDIDSEIKRMSDLGVSKVQDIQRVDDLGYVATFQDIEGNYIQLIQSVNFEQQQAHHHYLIN